MMTDGYSEPLTEKFLEDNPFLVLDTKFFSAEFKHKLVGSMEKVDEECNGLLIKSDNYQALNLLAKNIERVLMVFILTLLIILALMAFCIKMATLIAHGCL